MAKMMYLLVAHKTKLKIYISNENGLIERNIKSFQDDSENEDMESVFIDMIMTMILIYMLLVVEMNS